ncbi:MAG TPA: cell division protein FtsA [Bacillota bacterium]|nr:cell division protein FtsA [Bacillota bacterium]HPZ11645.1 cell division protein FtsA [Bacillota bacterium]HQE09498.1 cell division protein FtsA [Bacillota bacterium]
MVRKNYLVGIDVGTTQVRVIVGEPRPDGTVSIIGLGLSPSEGMKKGIIVDLELTIEAIAFAAAEAERMCGFKIDSACVGLPGLNTELINNRGVVAVQSDDREIRLDDIERVMQAARVIALPLDREIVEVIPREFVVDGYDGIRDPAGMLGVRLEVDAMIVTSPITSLRNLTRCVNRAGINVTGMVLQPLAAAEVALSADEKELGVFLVDIGGGTTDIAFFQEGKLQRLASVPVGGDHITNDLAMGLRTSFFTAENIKIEHGSASISAVSGEEDIEISSVGSRERRQISPQEISRYIEPRVQEIFQIIREEMIKMGWPGLPPAGAVFTGGVSQMKGLIEMAAFFFESDQVRRAEFDYVGIQNPIYTNAVGLLYYAYKQQPRYYQERGTAGYKKKPGLWQRFKDWLNEYIE